MVLLLCVPIAQAFACWQWSKYLQKMVPPEKQPLLINFDETAVCVFQGARPGNIMLAKNFARIQHVPRGQQRSYLTHLAFITDDPAVQPLLPQIIVGNERTVKARRLHAIRLGTLPNVRVLRRRSAWVDAAFIVDVIKWLSTALAPFMAARQPILYFDACRAHCHASVFEECAKAGIWPILIPASMTRLLQPLDTHVFLRYKLYLQKEYQVARVRGTSGQLNVEGLIGCINQAIANIIEERPWAAAFDGNGLSSGLSNLRARIKEELQLDSAALEIPEVRPTLAELKACFPQRSRHIPVASIWRAIDGAAPKAIAKPSLLTGLRRSARLAFRGKAASSSPLHALGARPKCMAAALGPPPSSPAKAAAAVAASKARARTSRSLAKAEGAAPAIASCSSSSSSSKAPPSSSAHAMLTRSRSRLLQPP